MPALLLRAIVTGFGYKLGAELGRLVAEKIGLKKEEADKKKKKKEEDEETGFPYGMSDAPGDEPPEDGDGPEGEDGPQGNAASN